MKKLYIFLLIAIGASLSSLNAQIISTYVGNGIQGYSGNGGQATSAEIYNPYYMSCDNLGNLYLVDATDGWLRKVDPISGIITTIAGTGVSGFNGDNIQATAANLSNPLGSAEDASGNVFISDQGASRIRVIDATSGIITTIAGNGYGGYTGDGGQATAAEIYFPSGLSVDALGNIYISDALNCCIRKVTKSSGIITTIAGNGISGFSGDGGPATAAEIAQPFGNIVDASGNVYIADGLNNVVRRIDAITGIITSFAGNSVGGFSGDGGQATAAEISFCYNLAFDPSGNILIADDGNSVIREVNISTGVITSVAGNTVSGYSGDGGMATAAEIASPLGLAADPSGNFFIGDISNNHVRKVTGVPTNTSQLKMDNYQATIYPNPANNNLNIIFSQPLSDITTLRVFDLSGRELITDHLQLSTDHYSLDVSSLSSGMYFMHIENKNGVVLSSKFIKE